MTQATVSHWETLEAAPHPSRWSEISAFLDLSMAQLFKYFAGVKPKAEDKAS